MREPFLPDSVKHLKARWNSSLRGKLERETLGKYWETKVQTHNGEVMKGTQSGGQKTKNNKNGSHPNLPTVDFKGQMRSKWSVGVHFIACSDDWRSGRIIHTFTHMFIHRLTIASLQCQHFLPFLQASVSFVLTYIWKGWQRWTHNLRAPKHRELDHPSADLHGATACLYLHPGCLVDFSGADCHLFLAPGSTAPLLRLLGNMTNPSWPCQTHDWHIPAYHHQFTPTPRQITPNPRQMTIFSCTCCPFKSKSAKCVGDKISFSFSAEHEGRKSSAKATRLT